MRAARLVAAVLCLHSAAALADAGAGAEGQAATALRAVPESSWPLESVTDNRYGGEHLSAIAVDGDTLVLGSARGNGAAYVYIRTAAGWTRQARLLPADRSHLYNLGVSVAISGDTVVVGADESGPRGEGVAFVFVRQGSEWIEQAQLMAHDGALDDYFGRSVAIAGDTILVGAPLKDGRNWLSVVPERGAAYVFVRKDGSWKERAKLTASEVVRSAAFGSSVALDGQTAAIGAPSEDIRSAFRRGSVYLFSAGDWSETARLVPADGAGGDEFGKVLALSGDTLVIGAHGKAVTQAGQGAVYVYSRSPAGWTCTARLTDEDGSQNDFFGSAVAVSGEVIAVQSGLQQGHARQYQGAVFLYRRAGTAWSGEATALLAPDATANQDFGAALALAGDRLVVGAYYADGLNRKKQDAGAVYVFRLAEAAK